MKFSLVVTCFNEMQCLQQWRREIEGQTRQPDEIVIVDSQSTDGTTEYLKEWARIDARVRIVVKQCNPAEGRNLAIQISAYDIIVSTDMGAHPASNWFEHLTQPFLSDPSVAVAAGRNPLDPGSMSHAPARAESYLETNTPLRCTISNRNSAYKREVWLEVGGLPEDLTFYADDSVFRILIEKRGYNVKSVPTAEVTWVRHSSLRGFWKEQWNYGRGNGEAMIRAPIAYRLHAAGYMPSFCVPLFTAIRWATRLPVLNALFIALVRLDIRAAAVLPLLAFGNGMNYGSGFLVGAKQGALHCRSTRSRIEKVASANRFTAN